MQFTAEQKNIIEAIADSQPGSLIAVNAVAGSGKTATCHGIINALKPKSGFYTAFNKAIVKESGSRFGYESNNHYKIECRTVHSLAYSCIRPTCVRGAFPYQIFDTLGDKRVKYKGRQKVLDTIGFFCNSPYLDIEDFIQYTMGYYLKATEEDDNVKAFLFLLRKYANYYLYEAKEITHDIYLKQFHIGLAKGIYSPELLDILILDECQDTSGVTLEIFKLLPAKKEIILGDMFQNIYSFRNTVNAFEELQPDKILSLTRCFRCGEEIAQRVEKFGRNVLDEKFCFKGNPNVTANTIKDDGTIAYLTRTNAHLVWKMCEYIRAKRSFNLGPNKEDDVFAIPIALHNAALGQKVQRNFSYLLDLKKKADKKGCIGYNNYLKYVSEELPDNIQMLAAAKLLKKLKDERINIIDLKYAVEKRKREAKEDYLSTIHSFKGLESNRVILADEVNMYMVKMIDEIKSRIKNYIEKPRNLEEFRNLLTRAEREELNLYYIAMSRARVSLENSMMEDLTIRYAV